LEPKYLLGLLSFGAFGCLLGAIDPSSQAILELLGAITALDLIPKWAQLKSKMAIEQVPRLSWGFLEQ
jgi:hypothetical protein